MSFDLTTILQSKRAMRHHLATQPVAEKLRMLDTLRERELAIRGKTTGITGSICDEPTPYRARQMGGPGGMKDMMKGLGGKFPF